MIIPGECVIVGSPKGGGIRAAGKPAKKFPASRGQAVYLAFLLSFCCYGQGLQAAESLAKDFYSARWRVTADSGWAASSGGEVELYSRTKSLPAKLRYSFNKNNLWQWPEIRFPWTFRRQGFKRIFLAQGEAAWTGERRDVPCCDGRG
jgi:hypothetical protein